MSVVYLSNSQFAEAKPVFERALMIEGASPQVLMGLNQLLHTVRADGHFAEAEGIYAWALSVSEEALGPDNANTTFLRTQYGEYLRSLERLDEADRLDES